MKSQFGFEAIGTWWEIDIEDTISKEQLAKIKSSMMNYLTEFDDTYSRFIPSSLISKIAEKPGNYPIPPDGMEMLHLYHDLYQLTQGAFTPLIGQTLTEAGYDAEYSFKEKVLTHPPSFFGTIKFLDDKTIKINRHVILDFGGIGKGYAIDKVSKIIEKYAVTYTINAGGDIFHCNALGLPLKIGMENPSNTKQVLGIVHLKSNQSVCSSAGNRRKWGKFHHILNPHTLTSPSDILAVWTVAETATIADAMATCLFLVKPEKLSETYKFEYFILYPDFSFTKSPGFDAELFT